MRPKPRLNKSDSKKTLTSMAWMPQELNESVDLDSEDNNGLEQGGPPAIHMLRSIFDDRPPTVFFRYPKCCGIEEEFN